MKAKKNMIYFYNKRCYRIVRASKNIEDICRLCAFKKRNDCGNIIRKIFMQPNNFNCSKILHDEGNQLYIKKIKL